MKDKSLFKALGLSLMAVLGLMAFMASSASAENLTPATHVHGKVLVNGSEALATNATFTGAGGLGQLLVPNLGVEVHCEKASLVEGKITNGPKGEGLAKALFENCKVFASEVGKPLGEELPCFISNGGASRHITATAILLVVTHKDAEGVDRLYLVAEPDVAEPLKSGEAFTLITYEAGKGCPIPLHQKITGTYAFEVTQTHQKELTISPGGEALQTLLGTGLRYGINPAFIDGGAAKGVLTGVGHVGLSWGVI